ncbi:MAG: hypothetical protein JSC189_000414 [Candidatus Tokpelaia sp. JSC189]|nr:MAG: hypothetical protein JSC189_000414 [Candidatus Tokpelaia sp. JSC189]
MSLMVGRTPVFGLIKLSNQDNYQKAGMHIAVMLKAYLPEYGLC